MGGQGGPAAPALLAPAARADLMRGRLSVGHRRAPGPCRRCFLPPARLEHGQRGVSREDVAGVGADLALRPRRGLRVGDLAEARREELRAGEAGGVSGVRQHVTRSGTGRGAAAAAAILVRCAAPASPTPPRAAAQQGVCQNRPRPHPPSSAPLQLPTHRSVELAALRHLRLLPARGVGAAQRDGPVGGHLVGVGHHLDGSAGGQNTGELGCR